MRPLKLILPAVIAILIALAVTACSGLDTTGNTPASNTLPTTAPTNPPLSPRVLIHTTRVNVKGKTETVLANDAGKALYYLTANTAQSVVCTEACAVAWPPLITAGIPTSSNGLPGRLTTRNDANGRQVVYDGHLLYSFSGDLAPGQANGEGITSFGGTWHVATPNL